MNQLSSLPNSLRKLTGLRHLLLRSNVIDSIELVEEEEKEKEEKEEKEQKEEKEEKEEKEKGEKKKKKKKRDREKEVKEEKEAKEEKEEEKEKEKELNCVLPLSVEYLDLQDNRLTSLPSDLSFYKKITLLRLSSNALIFLPDGFSPPSFFLLFLSFFFSFFPSSIHPLLFSILSL